MEKEWKSIAKIKKLFRTSKNQTIAIYNSARKNQISYYEAYRRLMRNQGNQIIWNEKIEKSDKILTELKENKLNL